MLTTTYSMVAIAVERDKTRGGLHRLQQYLQAAWKGLQDIDFAFLDTILDKLRQLDNYCHVRKIEVHLIPALRRASMEAQALLVELDALNARCESALQAAAKYFVSAIEMQSVKASEICNAIELYCNSLFIRLEKEEKELLPLAQRLLSIEDWFAIASQFLADDANSAGRRRQSSTAPRRAESEVVSGVN
jgi:hemerythrin-like domain-containing protein